MLAHVDDRAFDIGRPGLVQTNPSLRHTQFMNDRRASSGIAAHRRLSWALFCGVSALALGACVVAALATGGRSNVAVALLGGLIVVGIAAALMDSIVSPLPDHDGSRQVPYGSRGLGGGGFGGAGGGGSGGGDCGGGGGSCT